MSFPIPQAASSSSSHSDVVEEEGRKMLLHSTTKTLLLVVSLVLAASTLTTNSGGGRVDACIHDELDHKLTTHGQDYGETHPFELAERRRQRDRRRKLQDAGAGAGVGGDGGLFIEPQVADQAYDRLIGQDVNDAAYEAIRITPYYDNKTLDALPKDQREMIFKIIPDAIARFKLLLSVVPVQGNLMAKRSCDIQWVTTPSACKSFIANEVCLEMPIPLSHFAPARQCSTCLAAGCSVGDCKMTIGVGVPQTDFVLYVRAATTSYCTDSVIAYASSCQKDQYDRPTFGMANFCPSEIKTDPYSYQSQLSTAMHEITHALGFSAQFFPFMRFDDGTPRTPRDANGQPATSQANSKCANGKSASFYAPPSTETVQFTKERDTSVARMVTSRVAQFTQAHFNCSQLTGAEIENQDDGCLGSHWEERIFEPEYMTPVSSFRNVISGLTLAFFDDSGWYRTNGSTSERLHFGAKKGCAFAKSKCIDKATGTSIAPDHFCTANTVESCTVDASARSVCSISSGISDIPSAFQYFPGDATRGGYNEFADFCPINTGFKNGDCTVPDNLVRPSGMETMNILGETYCPTCKCTSTTLRSSDSTKWTVNSRRQTGCYAMKCPTNTTVEISVPVVGGGGTDVVKVVCKAKGQQVAVDGYAGTLTCPDPGVICERACPAACSGHGVCNFATAACACANGWGGDDCATNTTTVVKTTTSLRATSGGTQRFVHSRLVVALLLLVVGVLLAHVELLD